MAVERHMLVRELAEYFLAEGFTIHGAKGLDGHNAPPAIPNDGFGDLRPRVADIIGMDTRKKRIVFGIIREKREDLDSEDSLTDYNVFLDHRYAAGDQASLLVVLLPPSLAAQFTDIITYYVHREYWHRILPVSSKQMK